MNMPGFTAETSLHKVSEQYRILNSQNAIESRSMVFPQSTCKQDYDDCKRRCTGDQSCKDDCLSAYSLCVVGVPSPYTRRLVLLSR